ncbi:MAG: ClC family H(+)/Cl(-) exchange transporter, partial [Desulfomonilaceae bacterium]
IFGHRSWVCPRPRGPQRARDVVVRWAHDEHVLGFLVIFAVVTLAGGVAAWLVRRFSPRATGSGIPHVEAVLRGEVPSAPVRLIFVKYIGGFLAIGAGFALGREGPSVQMGAIVSHLLGSVFRRASEDCSALLAAGAGAGLATAFNAPIAGAVFVLEELVRRFDLRITIATLGASAGAIGVSRMLLGESPDFTVRELPYLGLGTVPIHLVLGVLAGLLGAAYNRCIVTGLIAGKKLNRVPVEVRAGSIGALIAILAWIDPNIVGGGDSITQGVLSGHHMLSAILVCFLIRFALGPLSYAAETPGGLFAPMLVLGAQLGYMFGVVCCFWGAHVGADPVADAVVGMAAFFTAVVRAPVTGIVLAIELTGSFTLLLPMLAACFTAMLVPTLLKEAPIYDSLKDFL